MDGIKGEMVIVFQGDSITDGGRFFEPNGVGKGYVFEVIEFLKKHYPDVVAYNRGTAKNRSRELLARWQEDALDLKPDIVTLMIGINDVWRKFDANDATSEEQFENNVREILESTKRAGSKIVLFEPYIFYEGAVDGSWEEEFEQKRKTIRKLAKQYADVFIPTHDIFRQMSKIFGWNMLVIDGVHPSALGVHILASLLIEALENIFSEKRHE